MRKKYIYKKINLHPHQLFLDFYLFIHSFSKDSAMVRIELVNFGILTERNRDRQHLDDP